MFLDFRVFRYLFFKFEVFFYGIRVFFSFIKVFSELGKGSEFFFRRGFWFIIAF